MLSVILAFSVAHQPELSAMATWVAIAAGLVSIIKAIVERK